MTLHGQAADVVQCKGEEFPCGKCTYCLAYDDWRKLGLFLGTKLHQLLKEGGNDRLSFGHWNWKMTTVPSMNDALRVDATFTCECGFTYTLPYTATIRTSGDNSSVSNMLQVHMDQILEGGLGC